ncbi:MAG: hypothetical protein ACYDCL_09425 [Myxococcales bacterium]
MNAFLPGVRTVLVPGQPFPVAGVSFDQASLLAKLEPVPQANQAVDMLRAQLAAKVRERDALHDQVRPFLNELRDSLVQMLGPSNPALRQFGIPMKRPRRQRTAAEKTISAIEGVRTRRVRGSYVSQKARQDITVEGKPGLDFVDPKGKVIGRFPPAPPGKPRPRRK